MANAMYTAGRNGLVDNTINWTTDTIHAVMVTSSYTFSAAHATMENANVPTAARVGSSSALTSTTKTGSALDAADLTFSSVSAGSTVDAVVIFKYVTSETSASSIPIAYIDTAGGSPISVATNGGDITFSWNASGLVSVS